MRVVTYSIWGCISQSLKQIELINNKFELNLYDEMSITR